MRRIAILSLLALAACGQDVAPVDTFNLDRPSAISFGCWGDLRVTNGADPTRQQEVVSSAQPVASCRARLDGAAPDGQQELDDDGTDTQRPNPQSPNFAAFVLQPSKGSVAVVQYSTDPALTIGATIIDADPFTPGRNSVGIGTLPVGLVTSPDGCYAISANAGSCDLSALDIGSALDRSRPPGVTRVQLYDGNGGRLLAKPAALVSEPPSTAVGFECPAEPQGITYVAYPDCNWVAAIDTATGTAVAGIQFGDGTVTVTDGAVTCVDACGSGAVTVSEHRDIVGGPGRPVALHMAEDGRRLYIGADNVAAVTVVELDTLRLPASVFQVPLDGDVGVIEVTASPVINMGGTTGLIDQGSAGQFQFAYAIATDATVRVADVHNLRAECDTQVDTRYLHDVRDVAFMSCMPVGDVRTPPRRQHARSPGIHLPTVGTNNVRDWEGIPLDIAITPVVGPDDIGNREPGPTVMAGYFAFITAASGYTFIANVDDDRYRDFEEEAAPQTTSMTLAIAHQLRDTAEDRVAINERTEDGVFVRTCTAATTSPIEKGPRQSGSVVTAFDPSYVNQAKDYILPSVRRQICTTEPPPAGASPDVLVSELDFNADLNQREAAFADLASVQSGIVRVVWEGQVSLDTTSQNIDGPTTRAGVARVEGGVLSLVDASEPFCRMGLEPYDIALFAGCDPSRGDSQCGVGETCFVHPEAPADLGSGTCVSAADEQRLAVECRDYMVSRRRYSITSTNAGRLELTPRRRVLETSPIEGCESATQCDEYYQLARGLGDEEHPVAITAVEDEFSWACEPDPSRAPGPNRCVMTCEASDDCEVAHHCQAGRCVEAPVPAAQCVAAIQRYQARVGDAYSIVSEAHGFLHNRIADSATGECIADPAGHPLRVGRVPLQPPACTGDGFGDVTPNPCSTTVAHTETYQPYEYDGSQCVIPLEGGVPAPPRLRTVDVPAVRVTTPGVRFNLVNLTTSGDEVCRADRASDRPEFGLGHSSLKVEFNITGGFLPLAIVQPTLAFPTTIETSPDGSLWVLDEGDLSVSTQGRIVRVFPELAPDGFGALTVSTGN